MFRFDFKDKSLIPPIFGTDNADYLERLCPVLERENIYPSGVVRLRDAAFCEERGIVHLSLSAEHTALLENEDYRRLRHRFGMDGDVIRSGLAAFPTYMAVEHGRKVLLFDKTDGGDRMLDEFLSGLAERFFDGKRAKIGDGQTVSSDMVRYGICVACCDMAPTLRNFNRLRNLQRQPMPLTGEQERIVSSLVARPDNVRFPNVEMRVRIPAKRKGQGMNI